MWHNAVKAKYISLNPKISCYRWTCASILMEGSTSLRGSIIPTRCIHLLLTLGAIWYVKNMWKFGVVLFLIYCVFRACAWVLASWHSMIWLWRYPAELRDMCGERSKIGMDWPHTMSGSQTSNCSFFSLRFKNLVFCDVSLITIINKSVPK